MNYPGDRANPARHDSTEDGGTNMTLDGSSNFQEVEEAIQAMSEPQEPQDGSELGESRGQEMTD